MKDRIKLYEQAIENLEAAKLKEVQVMTRAQKINIGVECILLAGMMVTVYILIHLTPSLL